jgi:hypothetical protein
MRPEAVIKMGYYPTPPQTRELILSNWLTASSKGAIALDPCCGRGEALARIAEAFHLETYGVELSPVRADEAKGKLDHVIGGAGWEEVSISSGVVSFALLNPPYDWEAGNRTEQRERMELTFLQRTTPKLRTDGVLCYIVPQRRIDARIARHLAGYYDHLVVRRLPGDEYQAFKQVVAFGTRKRKHERDPGMETRLLAWATAGEALPALDEGPIGPYAIPARANRKVQFYRTNLMPEDLVALTALHGGLHSRPFQDKMHVSAIEGQEALDPATLLKRGHIMMLMSGGIIGTLLLGKESGDPILLKGRSIKKLVKVDEKNATKVRGSGAEVHVTEEKFREQFVTEFTILKPDGELETVTEVERLTGFMEEHGEEIARHVIHLHVPRYAFDPTEAEWAAVERLAPQARLPNRAETGLLPTQKHMAIAIARALLEESYGVINGEMGIGKTITGTAVLEVLAAKGHDPYPAVVICPSHLVEKWVREVTKTIPEARAIIVERLPDVVRFVDAYRAGTLPHKSVIVVSKEMAKLGPGWEAAVLAKKVRVKWASDAEHVVTHYHCPTCGALQTDDEGLPILEHAHFARKRRFCAACGHALHQYSPGGSSYEAFLGWQAARILQDLQAEQRARRRTEKAEATVEAPGAPAGADLRAAIVALLGKLGCDPGRADAVLAARGFPSLEALTTAQAGEVHCRLDVAVAVQQSARAEAELGKWSPQVFLRALRESEVSVAVPGDVDRSCWSGALVDALKAAGHVERDVPQAPRLRRWALADYIRRYLEGFFGLLIGDEVHHYKGKSTDQGKAFGHLVGATRLGALGLTGTLFGGKSTDLFWLLYRLNRKLRDHYGFSDEKRWAEHYGRLEKVTKIEVAEEDGSFSGTTRRYNRVKELPGISPGIVRWVLPAITFLRLPDLGFPLPPLREEVVRLNMAGAQARQYDALYDELYGRMKEALKEGDNRLVSVWLTNVLCRPNAAFREEWVVQYRGTEKEEYVLDDPLPPVVRPGEWLDGEADRLSADNSSADEGDQVIELPRLLPKEQWLVDYVRAEASQGRKCIVYLQQTGTRDIEPRYRTILQEAEIRATILPSSVTAKKREKWIQKRVDQMDVLICHPKLVETGLDLIEFATVIFAEMHYSLYTLWQGARRVYRLTQTRPVKIVYAVYRDTMEEAALALMGEKLKAAQQLYGDEVGGALVQTDDGDFLEELARRVMTGRELPDLESLFAVENAKVASPMGSIAQPGTDLPAQPTVQELEARIIQLYGQAALHAMQRRRRRSLTVSDDHPTLFDLEQFGEAA